MIKILYVISTLQRSGPVNVLFNLVKYLNRECFEPIILTLSREPLYSSISDFEQIGVKILSLKLSRAAGVFLGPSRLKAMADTVQPDIIHSHGYRADCLSARYLHSYAKISTIHNYPFEDYPMAYGKITGYLMATNHLNSFSGIDYPIAVSKSLSRMLANKKGLKVRYIVNGIDDEIFKKPSAEEKRKLRKKLNIPREAKVFLSTDNLITLKDPGTTIRGFKQGQLKNGYLLILGDGPLRDKCIRMKGDCEHIDIRGKVSNINEFLKASDFFISSSTSEGFQLSVCEALVTGLPCILSDIPRAHEFKQSCPSLVHIFKVGDFQSLSGVLQSIMKTDYPDMSETLAEIAELPFYAKNMAQEYGNVYEHLHS